MYVHVYNIIYHITQTYSIYTYIYIQTIEFYIFYYIIWNAYMYIRICTHIYAYIHVCIIIYVCIYITCMYVTHLWSACFQKQCSEGRRNRKGILINKENTEEKKRNIYIHTHTHARIYINRGESESCVRECVGRRDAREEEFSETTVCRVKRC